jgi:hypothetical protein
VGAERGADARPSAAGGRHEGGTAACRCASTSTSCAPRIIRCFLVLVALVAAALFVNDRILDFVTGPWTEARAGAIEAGYHPDRAP